MAKGKQPPTPGPESAAPAPTTLQPTIPAVDAKLHYEELRKFHEKVIYAIGLLVIGVGILFYKNLSDAQDAATSAITRTEKAAKLQIDEVKSDAREEARKRVDEAFRQNNLQALIDEVAKKEVGAAVQRRIEEQFDRYTPKLREDMTAVARVFGLASQLRSGRWQAGRELIVAAEAEPNETGRRTANEQLAQISTEFEKATNIEPWPTNESERMKMLRNLANVPETSSEKEICAGCIKILADPYEQSVVAAYAFRALSAVTGREFKMFDIQAVKRWGKDADIPEEARKALQQL